MTPQDTINRLLDHVEESKRLFSESRNGLQKEDAELIHALYECEQLARNQIRILTRALKRYP